MIYETAQLTAHAKEAAALLFSLIVLLGLSFLPARSRKPHSNPDFHDGVHGLCNGCWTERWDLKELHCRGCRDDIDMKAW